MTTSAMRGSTHIAGLAVAGGGLLLIAVILILLAAGAFAVWSVAGLVVGGTAAVVAPSRGSQ